MPEATEQNATHGTFASTVTFVNQHDLARDCPRRAAYTHREPYFAVYNEGFISIIGEKPRISLAFEEPYPFAHEAGVFMPQDDSLFITSNLLKNSISVPQEVEISKLNRQNNGSWRRENVCTDVIFANGGINYKQGVLFCAQGSHTDIGGLVLMDPRPPYHTQTLLSTFHGRPFNSVNDIVVHSDGSLWFTDPTYGHEQGFRPRPSLPSQVYRFEPSTGTIRPVADAFGHPNGLCFSPDERTLYITDTDWIYGTGDVDDRRASNIYAFDLIYRHGSPFLTNRRLFAMADTGVPDGIKCDMEGNVYSGCGDGVSVWNAGGVLLGKIIVPGGVANFCFGRVGELFLLNECRFWVVQVATTVKGALLQSMGIEV